MTLNSTKTVINTFNFFSFLLLSIIGILIQLNYHLAKIPDDSMVLGFDRANWNELHSYCSVLFVIGILYHIYLNFPSVKLLFKRNRNSLSFKFKISGILTIVAFISALTGLISYIFCSLGNNNLRFEFMEIHDKLGILISVLFLLHFIQHFRRLAKSIRNFFPKTSLKQIKNANTI